MQSPEDLGFAELAYGAVKVGEYIDPACTGGAPPPPPPAFTCTNTLDAMTLATLVRSINETDDKANPYVRDFKVLGGVVSSSATCNLDVNAGDGASAPYMGVKVEVDGECWQHVHPHEYDVRYFDYLVSDHPGNSATFLPIRAFAYDGSSTLHFPASHPLSRWKTYSSTSKTPKLGRLGDVVEFGEMPEQVRTLAMAEALGADPIPHDDHAKTEQCGSPGEVANDPAADHRYVLRISDIDFGTEGLFRWYSTRNGKRMVHTMQSLYAPDQLRQRVAWALSQIYIVGEEGLGKNDEAEVWAIYYDIFVRHAFGNLRDILREVSWSPQMGVYLTYTGSNSLASSGTPPDENYARELMQLFSIGLWELEADGTQELDALGDSIQTYGTDEIQSFAKIWTGFNRQPSRGNVEARNLWPGNYFDPQKIIPAKHDHFPKMDLYHGHIGDGVPLCDAMPPHAFLRPGATYRYLSSGMRSELQFDHGSYETMSNQPRVHLSRNASSALHRKLCWPELPSNLSATPSHLRGARCTYGSEVIVDAVLPCAGVECDLEEPRTIGVEDADGAIAYYEYVPRPCVRLAFIEHGRAAQYNWGNKRQFICLDPSSTQANAACCRQGLDESHDHGATSYASCGFLGERVRYATAEARCSAAPDRRLCPWPVRRLWSDPNPLNGSQTFKAGCGLSNEYVWLGVACSVRVQIDVEGKVNLVHEDPSWMSAAEADDVLPSLKAGSANSFRVRWSGGSYPTAASNCSSIGSCTVSGETCICETHVETEAAVFTDASNPPSKAQIEATLFQGSPGPDAFAPAVYEPTRLPYAIYAHGASCAAKGGAPITTIEECSAAAAHLGLPFTTAVDDHQNEGSSWDPPFCYTEGPTMELKWNAGGAGGNIGRCSESDHCICFAAPLPPPVVDGMVECLTPACVNLARAGSGVTIFTRNSSLGAFDEHTIFRVAANGTTARAVHYSNARSTVRLLGSSSYSFRNPPVFMKVHDASERDAIYEVEALLDHLLYHKNTAPFIAHRLIQRLTTSNPSPRYVRAVGDAFKSGQYNGRTYSGRYGDLAASVAAILLDREASTPLLDADPSHGGVREPLVKLYHLMRALDFAPSDGREIELAPVDDFIGQAPFLSPTVFSFFLPEHVPAGAGYEANLFSPEAQAATAPLLIGFLNGATSLIRNGLNNCEGGFGQSRGCDSSGGLVQPRADGYLTWRPAGYDEASIEAAALAHLAAAGNGSAPRLSVAVGADGFHHFNPVDVHAAGEAVLDGLNVLLTAGKLENGSKAVISAAYHDALNATGSFERALQVAEEMVVATSEFGVSGDNAQRATPRKQPASPPFQNRTYKALVVVYLGGGADTYNMLTPHSHCANASGAHDLFAEYTATRTIAALPKEQLLVINASGSAQPCELFGLHPSMPYLASAYARGEAAFVANVGALVEPVTKAQILSKAATLPLSLFAHNVQTTAAFTVHAQNKNSASGVVGRILRALSKPSEGGYRSASWSLEGSKRILEGHGAPWILDKTKGIVEWQRQSALGWYVKALHGNESNSPFAETMGARLLSSIEKTQRMGKLLDEVTLETAFPNADAAYDTKNRLSQSLEQVAKVIKTRHTRQVERDVFYVQLGGWDTHNEVNNALLKNYHLVDQALEAFAAEMQAQGIWDNVVLQESSEFGRTLASNGRGTDHGWGGNAFVLGGKVRGGVVHGLYPDDLRPDSGNMYKGNSGRVIPTTSWEAIWKPLASWLGVTESASFADVLPNEVNFPPGHIITKDTYLRPDA